MHEHNSDMKNMNKNNSIVAVYPSHTAAEAAVKELQKSGFDMQKLGKPFPAGSAAMSHLSIWRRFFQESTG